MTTTFTLTSGTVSLQWDTGHTGDDDFDRLYFQLDSLSNAELNELLISVANSDLPDRDCMYLSGRISELLDFGYDATDAARPYIYDWEGWE